MAIIGIAHEYGPWSPTRFIPLPPSLRPDDTPAFYVATSRMCRGIHDWRCTAAETQTYGPLVLAGASEADLFRCDNCGRVQPPTNGVATAAEETCLWCSDAATVQHTAEDTDTTTALTAAAALHGAGSTLRLAKEADPDGYLALLDDTGECLTTLLEEAAWAVRQDPRRAKQTGYQSLALIARQVIANAREYAKLHVELLPVKESQEPDWSSWNDPNNP